MSKESDLSNQNNFKQDGFPFYCIQEIERRPDDFKLMERIPFSHDNFKKDRIPFILNEAQDNENVGTLIILDTETTGLDNKTCEIIELALVKLTYSIDRKILLSIDKIYDGFEQPSTPISPEITKLTSITNEMVQGKSFDESIVQDIFFDKDAIVIAHNASFDRPFFEKRFPQYDNYRWACSFKEIDWKILGAPLGQKLEALCYARGWFYDAHRADNDCLAIAWLLYLEKDSLRVLLTSEQYNQIFSYVHNSFSIKDALKTRGYKYDRQSKDWYKILESKDKLSEEEGFLNQYKQNGVSFEIKTITSKERYKA